MSHRAHSTRPLQPGTDVRCQPLDGPNFAALCTESCCLCFGRSHINRERETENERKIGTEKEIIVCHRTSCWSPIGAAPELKTHFHCHSVQLFVVRLSCCFQNIHKQQISVTNNIADSENFKTMTRPNQSRNIYTSIYTFIYIYIYI